MKKENKFYLIFISTITALRLWVFFFPLRKLMFNGAVIHHFWVGIILLLMVFAIKKRYNIAAGILFPISCGIIADELIYILFGGATVAEYWSGYSVLGFIIMAAIVFIFRGAITEKFYKNNLII